MRLQYENISLELLEFGRIQPDSNWSIRAHAHDNYEIHFITGGRGLNRIETGDLEFFPNIVYLAPPHEQHAQWSDRTSPLELYYISFNVSLPDQLRPLPRIYAPFSFVKSELDLIYQRGESDPVGAPGMFLTRIRLLELVWKVIGPYLRDSEPCLLHGDAPYRSGSPACELEQAILYIQRHFLRNPSLTEVAAACEVSPRHLTRLFIQGMGITPHQFVQNERFAWAVAELSYSVKPLRDIAESLHFSSMQYFSSWFKKMSSTNPSEFRRISRFT